MKRIRTGAVGLAATLLVTCCLAATAMASTSVVSAIQGQDRAVKSDQTIAKLEHFHATNISQIKKVIPAFKELQTKLNHAASVVSHASASSAKQRTGQNDWVKGVRQEATGVGQVAIGLQALVNHNASAARTQLKKGLTTLRAGAKLHATGDKLLGLPTKD